MSSPPLDTRRLCRGVGGGEEAEAQRPKMANRRAGTTNPSGNPSLGFCLLHSAAGQREVRERWRGGGTGVRWSEAAAGVWRRESGGRLRRDERSCRSCCGSCGLLFSFAGFGGLPNSRSLNFCSWAAKATRAVLAGAGKRVRLRTRPTCNLRPGYGDLGSWTSTLVSNGLTGLSNQSG